MQKRVIAFDVDGVVADLHQYWVEEYNRITGDNLSLTDITDWFIVPFMPKLSKREIVNIIQRRDVYEHVSVIEGVDEVISKLREMGHDILFVSDCLPTVFEGKYDFLSFHGLLQNREEFISIPTKHKHLLDVDLLIEDNLETALSHRRGVVFDQPWNRSEDKDVPRITGGWLPWWRVMPTISAWAGASPLMRRVD